MDIHRAVGRVGSFKTTDELLLYGDRNDFNDVALNLGITMTKKAEPFVDTFERAYNAADRLLDVISGYSLSGYDSSIILTTHRIFGTFLINALMNLINHPEFTAPEDRARYDRSYLTDYDLRTSGYHVLDIKKGEEGYHYRVVGINMTNHISRKMILKEGDPDKYWQLYWQLVEKAKKIVVSAAKNRQRMVAGCQ
ncbi:MAG: hypothetical protein ABIJ08_06110 [Nanoarchaeota archaeon]